MTPTAADVAECRKWAAFFRERGFNPLPSRTDDKRPLVKFAHLWEEQFPASEFDRWETSNVQVMTGRRWGLLVIDLDGPEAIERWPSMGQSPRTWVSHSGGGGRHLWFSIPRTLPPLPKAFLWRGEGAHSAVERLCDKSLVAAPPSIHPKTGRRYKWLDKRHSPLTLPKPAPCPPWILRLAPVAQVRPDSLSADHDTLRRRVGPGRTSQSRTPWRDVAGRLDVIRLARSWGLRTVGQPRQSGWLPCHAFDRDDRKPSAAIHVESGYYVDSGSGARMNLLNLAVAMNAYPTVEDAIKELRDQYGLAG